MIRYWLLPTIGHSSALKMKSCSCSVCFGELVDPKLVQVKLPSDALVSRGFQVDLLKQCVQISPLVIFSSKKSAFAPHVARVWCPAGWSVLRISSGTVSSRLAQLCLATDIAFQSVRGPC